MSHALLHYLARRYGRPAVTPQRIGLPGMRLRRISDFIDAHIDATIRISDLAQLADLSEGHFHRAFRVTTGQTPLTFINARRVAAAKHALVRSDVSITQISLDVGFLSPTHFARIFRAATGQAPSAYRRIFRI